MWISILGSWDAPSRGSEGANELWTRRGGQSHRGDHGRSTRTKLRLRRRSRSWLRAHEPAEECRCCSDIDDSGTIGAISRTRTCMDRAIKKHAVTFDIIMAAVEVGSPKVSDQRRAPLAPCRLPSLCSALGWLRQPCLNQFSLPSQVPAPKSPSFRGQDERTLSLWELTMVPFSSHYMPGMWSSQGAPRALWLAAATSTPFVLCCCFWQHGTLLDYFRFHSALFPEEKACFSRHEDYDMAQVKE